MKSFKHTLALVACALAASGALADQIPSVDVQFGNPIFTKFSTQDQGYAYAKIYAPNRTKGIEVNAGRYQGTASNLVEVAPSIFVNSVDELFLYCYDIYEAINKGNSVKYTIDLNGEASRTLDFLGAVNSVMSIANGYYDPFAWLRPTSGKQSAAIQLGIWESLYENKESNDWTLDDGLFKADHVDNVTLGIWDSYKKAIGTSKSLDGKYVMVLRNAGKQDMLVGDPTPVPEPGSLALLGLGLSGLAFAKRRKAKR